MFQDENTVKCIECKVDTWKRPNVELCDDCYEKFFWGVEPKKTTIKEDEEPDFVLKHEVAVVKPTGNYSNNIYLTNGSGFDIISVPKAYKIDMSKIDTFEEFKAVFSAIASEITIFDTIKDFESIKPFLKEI